MSTILGSSLTEQPIKFGWSRERGPYTTKEWRGTEARVRSKITEVIAQGGSYDVERLPGDVWKIVAQFATSEGAGGGSTGGAEITETWELLPKDAQKDILSSYHSLVSGLTQANIDQIRTDVNSLSVTAANTTLTGNALVVFKLMKAGVENVEIEQPVLSHNWIVPVNANLSYAYANIGRIYTTSSLISSEGVPSYLASSLSAWTSSFSDPSYGTNRISLVFGWKKRPPTQRVTNDSRREISQTWEYGLWSTDVYGSTV